MCKVSSGYSDLQRDGIADESDKLVQGVIETIDLAKTQKIVLSQLDDDLQEALAQVRLVSLYSCLYYRHRGYYSATFCIDWASAAKHPCGYRDRNNCMCGAVTCDLIHILMILICGNKSAYNIIMYIYMNLADISLVLG